MNAIRSIPLFLYSFIFPWIKSLVKMTLRHKCPINKSSKSTFLSRFLFLFIVNYSHASAPHPYQTYILHYIGFTTVHILSLWLSSSNTGLALSRIQKKHTWCGLMILAICGAKKMSSSPSGWPMLIKTLPCSSGMLYASFTWSPN